MPKFYFLYVIENTRSQVTSKAYITYLIIYEYWIRIFVKIYNYNNLIFLYSAETEYSDLNENVSYRVIWLNTLSPGPETLDWITLAIFITEIEKYPYKVDSLWSYVFTKIKVLTRKV